MINPKEHVNRLFQSALEGEKSLSRLETDGNYLAYYDEDGYYERHYYYDDTQEFIAGRILMDSKVESFLPKDKFAGFLMLAGSHMGQAGPDTFMVMEKLALIWDNEEGMSPVRDALEKEYGDEYAQYIAEDLLGQTWVERQIPVINMTVILESCKEIHMPNLDGPFDTFFLEAVLQTIFHELRHLFYECNEIVPIGKGTPYPQNGGIEDEVEDYGNAMATKMLHEFIDIVNKDALNKFLAQEGI